MPTTHASENTASDAISLQGIVDGHLKRLLDLRDGLVACHAGLVSTSELEWEQYRSSLPPEPRVGGGTSFQSATLRGAAWLMANALKDMLSLHVIYFEHLRQIIELAEVSRMDLEKDKKNAEAHRRMAAKPQNLEAAMQELNRILVGGFPREPEMRSFEVLFAIFASQLSGAAGPGIQAPVSVVLCQPEITGQPGPDRQLPYAVQRIERAILDLNDTRPDKELLYQIFFTAFAIARDTAEKCHATLVAARDEASSDVVP